MTNEEIANIVREEATKQGLDGNTAYLSAMAASRIKDEQFAKEKQQLIDEACKWLAKNDSYVIPTNVQVDRLREYLNNIK